ncbi:putative tellurium resistance membrane protein TerC [Rhabdobacter roseus]|uniref:Putative tellurium resistance membrane protein TerC n=1 Tax=Rhabdobacter roseus TaxID=1655419 RepID=A0A840TMU4_9BACT|nr:putative tellurium resistance membrane protein TerC [Rhabdobacter roseus]
MDLLLTTDAVISLRTQALLEVGPGSNNIIFTIAISTKLPENQQI